MTARKACSLLSWKHIICLNLRLLFPVTKKEIEAYSDRLFFKQTKRHFESFPLWLLLLCVNSSLPLWTKTSDFQAVGTKCPGSRGRRGRCHTVRPDIRALGWQKDVGWYITDQIWNTCCYPSHVPWSFKDKIIYFVKVSYLMLPIALPPSCKYIHKSKFLPITKAGYNLMQDDASKSFTQNHTRVKS